MCTLQKVHFFKMVSPSSWARVWFCRFERVGPVNFVFSKKRPKVSSDSTCTGKTKSNNKISIQARWWLCSLNLARKIGAGVHFVRQNYKSYHTVLVDVAVSIQFHMFVFFVWGCDTLIGIASVFNFLSVPVDQIC